MNRIELIIHLLKQENVNIVEELVVLLNNRVKNLTSVNLALSKRFTGEVKQ